MDDLGYEVVRIVGAGIVGVIGTLISVKFQRKNPRLKYFVKSIPLLRFKPVSERSLKVSAEKKFITGNPDDTGLVDIQSAFGFSIPFRNVGNEVIENLDFEIEFDTSTRILEFSSDPDSRIGYEITVTRDAHRLNCLQLNVPYINEKDTVHLGVITTGNEDSSVCHVRGASKGVKVSKHKKTGMPWAFFVGAGIAGFGASILFDDMALKIFSKQFIKFLGGDVIDESTVSVIWPIWYKIVGTVGLVAIFLGSGVRSIIQDLDLETQKPWEK